MNQSKLCVCGCLRAIIGMEYRQEIDNVMLFEVQRQLHGGRPHKCVCLQISPPSIETRGHVYCIMVFA